MKVHLAKTFADEEDPMAEEGKAVNISGDKRKLLELCNFFTEVENHIVKNETYHMHFSLISSAWNKNSHIDVIVDIDE